MKTTFAITLLIVVALFSTGALGKKKRNKGRSVFSAMDEPTCDLKVSCKQCVIQIIIIAI